MISPISKELLEVRWFLFIMWVTMHVVIVVIMVSVVLVVELFHLVFVNTFWVVRANMICLAFFRS